MEELEKSWATPSATRSCSVPPCTTAPTPTSTAARGIRSNERLEFLGDAVLGFVSAEHLFKKHPELPEGDLTRIRAAPGVRRAQTRWPSP